MAHQLWPAARDAAPSRDTLHFLRTDKEAGLGLVPTPLNERLSFDWSGLIANSQHRSFRRILADHHREGRTGQFRGAHLAWYAYCENLYEHLSAIFVQYEAVVTNRLHAMIFARLLGRRAAYIDNYYGKLSRYADLWLSGQHELSALARPSRA